MRTQAQAFNEWMRRYTEEPETFEAQFRTCGTYLADVAEGVEPTYGEAAAAYLASLMNEGAQPADAVRNAEASSC